jgi:hypothetical protein
LTVCVAGILGVWLVGSRLNGAVDNVFALIDSSLVAVRDRVIGAGERVRAAIITSEDIKQSLKKWTEKEARERLGSQLGLEEKADQLASTLQRADHWLEVSESSVELVQQTLELGRSPGAPVESQLADRLLEELVSLRVQLTQAVDSVERIRRQTAEVGERGALKEGVDQAVRLTLRVIATLGSVDSRLGAFGNRLSETQTKAEKLKAKTLRWLRIAAVGVTLLMLWMAAGQISLCIHGWRSLRQSQTGRTPDENEPSLRSTEVENE